MVLAPLTEYFNFSTRKTFLLLYTTTPDEGLVLTPASSWHPGDPHGHRGRRGTKRSLCIRDHNLSFSELIPPLCSRLYLLMSIGSRMKDLSLLSPHRGIRVEPFRTTRPGAAKKSMCLTVTSINTTLTSQQPCFFILPPPVTSVLRTSFLVYIREGTRSCCSNAVGRSSQRGGT